MHAAISHASGRPPDVILHTSFTRPSTALGDRRPGTRLTNPPFNGSNLHSNYSNPIRMFRTCIPVVQIPYEWFEFAFECFKSLSNGSNLIWMVRIWISNASNIIRMVWIWFRMVRIPLEWFEFVFEWLESLSNSFEYAFANFVRLVRIRIVKIPFQWFKFEFKCFQCRSNSSNLVSNG